MRSAECGVFLTFQEIKIKHESSRILHAIKIRDFVLTCTIYQVHFLPRLCLF